MSIDKRIHTYKPIKVVAVVARPNSMIRLILAFVFVGIVGSEAADMTVNRQAVEARFLETRTQAVLQMDGDFFREEKFTPEQIDLFITTRISAEDTVMEKGRREQGTVFLPSMLTKQLDVSIAKAFNPDIAGRYRAWVDARLGWQSIWDNPILNARDWLTFEEQDRLARAWGPISAASMDVTFDPKFEKATRKEKRDFIDRLSGDYFKAAADVLDSEKLAELGRRLNEMRRVGLKEMDADTE